MRWSAARGAGPLSWTAAAAGVAALALLAAGCGGDGDGLTRTAGEQLAARSDAVAARLEAGNSCAARRAATALRRDVQRLLAGGAVRGETAVELRSRVSSLVRAIGCVPSRPPPAVVAPAVEDDHEEDGGQGQGKGTLKQKDGRGPGHGGGGEEG